MLLYQKLISTLCFRLNNFITQFTFGNKWIGKKEVEEGLKEFEIREVNIVNNKIENNRKIRKYSGKRNKR